MRILRRFFSLPIRKQRLLVLAIILLFFFKIALRCFSLKTLLLHSSKVYPLFGPHQNTVSVTADVVWAVSTVAKYVPGLANCLTNALAAKLLLALEGCPSVLEIGAKIGDSNRLTAHAWLSIDDKILIGSSERSGYVALPRFDGEKHERNCRRIFP